MISAMKGDSKSAAAVLRLAGQTGDFAEESPQFTKIERVIVRWHNDQDDEAAG